MILLFCCGVSAESENRKCIVFTDMDGDGFGTEKKIFDYDCSESLPTGYALKYGDCNDRNKYINPDVAETCNGIDDNCDGLIDPENSDDCNKYYSDKDEDGFGDNSSKCLCVSEKEFSTLESGDCDDNNRKVYPGIKESCNEIDDNCNGEVDEGQNTTGCRPFYVDTDGDGYGVDKDNRCLCKPDGLFRADMYGDCNDNNPGVHPGAHEYFDRIDNNCNGVVDENPGTAAPARKKHHEKHGGN